MELVGLNGYAATSVADVLLRSGVSRRSFYELFPSRVELLRATFQDTSSSALKHVQESFERSSGAAPQLQALLQALIRSARARPGTLALWCFEITAHPEGQSLRSALMERYADLLQTALSTTDEPPLPSSLAATLAGTLHRAIHSAVHEGQSGDLTALPLQLARWARCYSPLPAAFGLEPTQPRRLIGRRLGGGRAPGTLLPLAERYVPSLGSPSSGFRAHANRERILDAVAQIAAESGSAALGAQVILQRAQVPENFFRTEFKNADGALLAALELGHLKCRAALSQAQAHAPSWTSRVRAATQTLLEFFSSEQCFAHLAFVQAPCASPASACRTNEHIAAYTQLMFDGVPRRRQLPALAASFAMHSLVELITRAALEDRLDELPDAAPEATYLALAPFVGPLAAAKAASS